ncbi:M56 family metallopeptidase [Niabella hibiscisoli]|uniref:M56 family metallopeptidase n=1 Tax=Niabella hibiscisoli TaxID=1825928 RepID=UPI001F10631B|nr:M56 family metallopeptidase [Niabella hibiscisoli]MCH5721300.1 M56 family metallopeptidase [Niabella hibiscisoli]
MNQDVETSLRPNADSGGGIINIIAVTFAVVNSYLMFRLIRNYLIIKKAVRQGQVFLIEKIQVVLLDQPLTPHSFLNTIFLNRDEYNSGKVEAEVIQHEIAHVKQKHSWDICLLELVQVFAWFNPVIYLYKKSIKINHELLADASVVKQLDNVRSYQEILLRRAIAQSTFVLASSFTFYTTKKRLVMLTKK